MTDGTLERAEGHLPEVTPGSTGHLWRLGSASLLLLILVIDFLALDDITTAGAWMPEIIFLIASIPALLTTGYFTFRRSPDHGSLPAREGDRQLPP